jgi:hypothetical protein
MIESGLKRNHDLLPAQSAMRSAEHAACGLAALFGIKRCPSKPQDRASGQVRRQSFELTQLPGLWASSPWPISSRADFNAFASAVL